MSDKPSAAWYLAPIFLGIVGSAIMWYVLKDEDHLDSPKMIKKGWVIGIVLTLIPLLMMIPMLILIPMTAMNDFNDMQDHMMVIPGPVVQMVPAPGFEDVTEMIDESIPEKTECEMDGGLWGTWGNAQSAKESCNPSTFNVGMKCSDSSQCQSFCQAKEGSEINSEGTGTCYGYELAICMQEVQNGMVQNEWCQ